MDLQKHGFWVGLGVVLLIELGILFVLVLPADGDVEKESGGIKATATLLSNHAKKPFIPNNNDIKSMNELRREATGELVRSMIYLAAIDAMTLERRWQAQGGAEVTSFAALRPERQTKADTLTKELVAGKGKYRGLLVKNVIDEGNNEVFPVIFPDLKNDEEVALFYRRWWIMKTVLDDMLAPAADAVWQTLPGKEEDRTAPWQLMDLSFGLPDQIGKKDANSYVNEYLPVKIKVRLKVIEVDRLLGALLNSAFLMTPAKFDMYIDSEDPQQIPIHVDIGEKRPSDAEIAKMASRKRPDLIVEVGLNVADLDPERLLKVGKKFRKNIGDLAAVQKFIQALKDDPDFIKPYEGFDKNAFLDRMTDELMKD